MAQTVKNPHAVQESWVPSLGREYPLDTSPKEEVLPAILISLSQLRWVHQEQLMATISLLWKVNFCWKPWGAEGGEGPWGWAQSSRPSPFLPLRPGQLSTLFFFF